MLHFMMEDHKILTTLGADQILSGPWHRRDRSDKLQPDRVGQAELLQQATTLRELYQAENARCNFAAAAFVRGQKISVAITSPLGIN